MSRGF